jgi:hypothetical protein
MPERKPVFNDVYRTRNKDPRQTEIGFSVDQREFNHRLKQMSFFERMDQRMSTLDIIKEINNEIFYNTPNRRYDYIEPNTFKLFADLTNQFKQETYPEVKKKVGDHSAEVQVREHLGRKYINVNQEILEGNLLSGMSVLDQFHHLWHLKKRIERLSKNPLTDLDIPTEEFYQELKQRVQDRKAGDHSGEVATDFQRVGSRRIEPVVSVDVDGIQENLALMDFVQKRAHARSLLNHLKESFKEGTPDEQAKQLKEGLEHLFKPVPGKESEVGDHKGEFKMRRGTAYFDPLALEQKLNSMTFEDQRKHLESLKGLLEKHSIANALDEKSLDALEVLNNHFHKPTDHKNEIKEVMMRGRFKTHVNSEVLEDHLSRMSYKERRQHLRSLQVKLRNPAYPLTDEASGLLSMITEQLKPKAEPTFDAPPIKEFMLTDECKRSLLKMCNEVDKRNTKKLTEHPMKFSVGLEYLKDKDGKLIGSRAHLLDVFMYPHASYKKWSNPSYYKIGEPHKVSAQEYMNEKIFTARKKHKKEFNEKQMKDMEAHSHPAEYIQQVGLQASPMDYDWKQDVYHIIFDRENRRIGINKRDKTLGRYKVIETLPF